MGDLSKNFNKSEFACSHCKTVFVTKELGDSLQELRDLAGRPVDILCGYRCALHNKAIGGAKNSLHVAGKAADIQIVGLSVKETYELAKQVKTFQKGGIGIYPQEHFVHVDVRSGAARWARVDGAYVGISEGLKWLERNLKNV
jgi:uncharacterized protein YcbK (DUF882 family)